MSARAKPPRNAWADVSAMGYDELMVVNIFGLLIGLFARSFVELIYAPRANAT
jgi:selenophosphate synthase